jgi:hypothetical protein
VAARVGAHVKEGDFAPGWDYHGEEDSDQVRLGVGGWGSVDGGVDGWGKRESKQGRSASWNLTYHWTGPGIFPWLCTAVYPCTAMFG